MDRRNFIRNVAVAGAAGASAEGATPKQDRTVKYSVEGFTCITCAVGLETLLRGEKGVVRASASYPNKLVEIGFDSRMTNEKALTGFIAACGFKARPA